MSARPLLLASALSLATAPVWAQRFTRLRGLAGAADVETGSGRIDITAARGASLKFDASTGSGSITLKGVDVSGTVEKRRLQGTVAGGANEVKLVSRSGSIRIAQ
jgi:hypothetical protein